MYSVDGVSTADKAFDAMGALATIAFACKWPLYAVDQQHCSQCWHMTCRTAQWLGSTTL